MLNTNVFIMGYVTSFECYVTLCRNASLSGPRYIYCVVFICTHSSHTTASSPSTLCRIEDSLSTSDSIVKKLKEESKISFKFEGNKKQFYFNSGLAEKVHSASTALNKGKLEVVRGYLEDIGSDMKKRNKLIRLADKSAAGWDLVSKFKRGVVFFK